MESTPQQAEEGKAVVTVLAAVLERLVNSNAQSPTIPNNNSNNCSGAEVTKFHALKAPGISIKQYLERIHKYASCSTECFVLALIYIDRLIQNSNFRLSELNVHRVIITAILLAAKFFDDAYYNNAYYAKVGGVLVSEMNGLEVEFLFRINFSLHVKPDVFAKYQEELVSHVVGGGPDPQQDARQFHLQPPPPPPPTQESLSMTGQGSAEQMTRQQPLYAIPAQAVNGVPVTISHQYPCGNVTPSPPHNMDVSQQQCQQQSIQDVQPHHHNVYPQQCQSHAILKAVQSQVHHIDHPFQQQQQQPYKNYPIQNNTEIHIPVASDLFMSMCPMSSSGIFNTMATRMQ
jgi:hypothetical protein